MADKPKHGIMVIMGAAPPPGRRSVPPQFGAPKKDETAAPPATDKAAEPDAQEPEQDGDCDECAMWLADSRRCLLHGPDDEISPEGWCRHWRSNLGPTSCTNKAESGYQEPQGNSTGEPMQPQEQPEGEPAQP